MKLYHSAILYQVKVSVCNRTENCKVLTDCGSTDLNSTTVVLASGKSTKYRDVILSDKMSVVTPRRVGLL